MHVTTIQENSHLEENGRSGLRPQAHCLLILASCQANRTRMDGKKACRPHHPACCSKSSALQPPNASHKVGFSVGAILAFTGWNPSL